MSEDPAGQQKALGYLLGWDGVKALRKLDRAIAKASDDRPIAWSLALEKKLGNDRVFAGAALRTSVFAGAGSPTRRRRRPV